MTRCAHTDAGKWSNDAAIARTFGIPSQRWGEEVVAAIAMAARIDHAALHAHLADRLVAYTRPKHFVEVNTIRRNALGKIQRHVLRDEM